MTISMVKTTAITALVTLLTLISVVSISAQDYSYGLPTKKQAAWKGWEIHAAASTSLPHAEYWTVSRSYQLVENGRTRFVRNDGSVVSAGYGEGDNWSNTRNPDEPYISNKLYQLGLNRVSSWGGSFRFSLGYYRTRFRIKGGGFTNLEENEIRTFTDAKEQSVFGEFGFHYNFFRRHRFRPYLGINFTSHLYYNGYEDERFVEGSTGEVGLVRRFSSKEHLPIYPDYSITVGFQYQISEQISAGAFVWANNGYDLWIDAPFGIEMRYSLGERPLRARRNRE